MSNLSHGVDAPAPDRPRLLVAGPTPPPYAGVETFTQTVVTSEIVRTHFDLSFCNMQKPITNEQRGRLGMINITYNLSHLWRMLRMSWRLRPDVTYLPLSQNRTGFFRDSLLLVAARPFSRRVVYQVHGGSFDEFYHRQPAWFQFYTRWIFRRADAFFLGGERLRRQFGNMIAPGKFHVAAYGVRTNFPPRSRPVDDDLREIRILFMGHISFAKGAVDLIRALPLIREDLRGQTIRIQIQLAGEFINKERNILFIPERDNASDTIQQIITEHELHDVVTFLGVVKDQQKLQTLVDSDIFVLPSYTEAIGLSVMEAMAAGLPVVVTPAGALPDMLTHGTHCLFVNPGAPFELAQQLLALIHNRDLRQQMGCANRAIIEAHYNEEAFLERLVAAFDEVLVE